MLKISDRQIEVLSSACEESFIKELIARLVERSPELAQTLDEEARDNAARRAFAGAKLHGLTNRGPARMYFDLCVIFGEDFVEDPIHSWAARSIGEPDPETQTERAEAVFVEAQRAVEAMFGPDDEYAVEALNRLSSWARQPLNIPEDGLEEYVLWQLHSIHPEKADFAGPVALSQLFREARDFCAVTGVRSARAVVLITALKFAFGSGCIDDPLYGWIGATLSDEKVPDKEKRFERLERKALVWLDAVLKNQA